MVTYPDLNELTCLMDALAVALAAHQAYENNDTVAIQLKSQEQLSGQILRGKVSEANQHYLLLEKTPPQFMLPIFYDWIAELKILEAE